MKIRLFFLLFLLTFIPASISFAEPLPILNRIEGMVYDPNRVPVNDVRIELLNEVGSILSSTKTFSGGRFSFSGISSGRFIIKVIPIGLNFLEESKDVEVVNIVRNGSDTVYVDIYLRYDKRSADSLQNTHAESVFVQEIPQDAKKFYQAGIDSLKKDQDKGITELENAIRIFPDYFDALSVLGREYLLKKDYEKAIRIFIRAVAINQRSSIDFYRMGYALYETKQYSSALEAAKSAATLVPDSMDAQLLYGTILRINMNLPEAERVLLKANSLAKGKKSEVHWQLALLYNRLNKNQSAIDELQTFLKLDPNSPDKINIMRLIEKLKSTIKSK